MINTVVTTSCDYKRYVVVLQNVAGDVSFEMTPFQAVVVANSILRAALRLQTDSTVDFSLKQAADLLHEALGGTK